MISTKSKIPKTKNLSRHRDERSEEAICLNAHKLLTDSFSLLHRNRYDISNPLRAPLNPLKGKSQRAFQKLSEPVGWLATLGDRGCDGISCKTFPISRSKSQQPMAKSQKQYNNIAI
jgi:hypothetical protein